MKTAKHAPAAMELKGQHYHKRSTQRGSSWMLFFVCPTCGAEKRPPMNFWKNKPAPICKGGVWKNKWEKMDAETECRA